MEIIFFCCRFVFFAIFLPLPCMAGVEGCPKKCFCNPVNNYVYCSKKGLHIIPDMLPPGTQQLNLNGNNFRSRILQKANLSSFDSLEHLYISECGLEEIEVGAFSDLASLEWLDLSENKLTHIHENTFQGLTLKHLFLNNNHMLQLTPRSFIGLVTNGLHLHNCSLSRILPEILEPLKGTLKNLWLNGNLIETFDEQLKSTFSTLLHLRIGVNPIRCKCDTAWLKDFFDAEPNVFKGAEPPSCRSPARMKGQSFENLTKAQFVCQAPAFKNIEALFETDHANLKCSAGGDPTPTLFWILPSGRTFKYLPRDSKSTSLFSSISSSSSSSSSSTIAFAQQSPFEESNLNEALLNLKISEHSAILLSDPISSNVKEAPLVTGDYVCVANNHMGNVTLIIKVAWPNRSERHHHGHHGHHRHHHADNSGSAFNLQKPFAVGGGTARHKDAEDESRPRTSDHVIIATSSSPGREEEETFQMREPGDAIIHRQSMNKDGIFSLAELVVAVVATHLLTVALVLCLLFIRNTVIKSRRQKARYIDGPLHHPAALTPTGPLINSTPRLQAHLSKDRLQNSDPTYDKVGQSFSDIYSNSSVARYPHHQFINR